MHKPILGFCRPALPGGGSTPSNLGTNRRLLEFLSTWAGVSGKTVDFPLFC